MGLLVVRETRRAGPGPSPCPGRSRRTCSRRPPSCPIDAARIDDPTTSARLRGPPRPASTASTRRDLERRRPDRRRRRDRDPRPARPAAGPRPSGSRRLPAAGALHRERRPRDSGRGARRQSARRAATRAPAPSASSRYVNALLEKKPTVSLPSAREVLRTRIGDCNEHTVLYVAMARAAGHSRARSPSASSTCTAPSTTTRGPRSTSTRARRAATGCPSIPTLNQFPADAHAPAARTRRPRQAGRHPAPDRPR